MRPKKIAVLITFILAITAQTAFAKGDGYGVKNQQGQITSYDKVELQQSFIENNGVMDNCSQVLASTSTKLETKKFPKKTNLPFEKIFSITFNQPVDSSTLDKNISVLDSRGRSVPVGVMRDLFDENIVWVSPPPERYKEGESYTLRLNKGIGTMNHSHLKYDVIMDFSIKAKDTGNKPIDKPTDKPTTNTDMFKVRSHKEMVSILKYMSDGIYKDIVLSDEDGYFEPSKYFKDWDTDPCTVIQYKKVIKKAPYLDSKYYGNPKYQDLCDLNNFLKIPNLSINFDKVYNGDRYDSPLRKAINCQNAKGEWSIPKDLGDCVLQPHCVGKTWYFSTLLGDDKRFFKFIWRPDIEQQVVQEVNRIRQSKGMKPLTIKNDLWAMARYSAKRSQFGFSRVGLKTLQLFTSSHGGQRYWVPGYVPSLYEYTGGEGHGGKACTQSAVKLDSKIAKDVFGYEGDIGAVSWNSNFYTTGKQFINKLLYSTYPDDVTGDSQSIQMKDIVNDAHKYLLNPNTKYIGVGSTHETPTATCYKNGNLGVFIVVGD